jgi:uncharacterized Zn-finger protein
MNNYCPYCDTAFEVDCEDEDMEVMNCPFCGEELPPNEAEDWDFWPEPEEE